MKINKVFCLFEQSGTFKQEFIKLGIPAEDYDILNDFGQTDHIIDLFAEIEKAYDGAPSLFDTVTPPHDLIFAFFPCIRFENQIMLHFRGQTHQQANSTTEEKMLNDMRLMSELSDMYYLINKLFLVCMRRGLRLIVENPYSEEHFLRRYWCIPPALIDRDRRDNGDYYKKPTQYWFVNCTPEQNVLWEPLPDNALKVGNANRDAKKDIWAVTGAKNKRVSRSMIHPVYANRFIRQFIL